jgi:hypothetical protein
MAVSRDIAASYLRPRAVFARLLGQGTREDRALVFLILACALIFVAQWPRLARAAHLDPSVPLQARLGATLLVWVFVVPLVMYALAGLSHGLAQIFGGRGDWFSARLALFWALLVASPLWLLNGLVAGFIGPGPILDGVGFIALVGFLLFWTVNFWQAEWGQNV